MRRASQSTRGNLLQNKTILTSRAALGGIVQTASFLSTPTRREPKMKTQDVRAGIEY